MEHNRRIPDANYHTITQHGNEEAAARWGQAAACNVSSQNTGGTDGEAGMRDMQQAMGGEGAVGSDGCVYIIRRAAGV